MPDITKGYTFSDSKAEWASDKETALLLNRMVDDAKVNLVAGTNITISRGSSGITINSTASGSGTVTGVTVVSANGLAGTASAAPVPAITLSTTVSGIVKGNGTALSAASAGTDYQAPITLTTTGTSGAATFTSNTLNIPNYTGGGGGDVFGPSSSVDNKVAFFDGTTGKLIKDSGLSLIGTNTGDQTISLTGDVTGSGAGSFVTSIAAGVIVDADINASAAIVDSKLATISTASKVSNSATTATSANTASAIVARDASGNFSAGTITASLTGNVSGSSGSTTGNAATVTTNANLTGDVTSVGNATTIASSVVSNAKLANVATSTFKGRTTAGTGSPEDLTSTQATAMLNTAVGDAGSGGTKGLVPAPVTGDATKFLRGDMTYQTISGGGNALTSNPLSQFASTTSSQLAGVISDETGSGSLVFATSPTLVTPVLGAATGTSFNSITGLSSTTPIANGTAAVGVGTTTARGDHVHPTTGLGLTASGLNQFASTTSAQLAGVISDETGTGALVFATSPTLITPALGTPTSGLLNSCTSNPNATGNVPRTFQNRAGDVFNVKDFGATGDGSTSDQTAIAAALTAAVASIPGGTVYFPAGRYLLTDTLTASFGGTAAGSVVPTNLTIRGEGMATVLQQSVANKGIFDLTNTHRYGGIRLSAFRVQNTSSTYSSSAACMYITCSEEGANDWCPTLTVDDVAMVAIAPPGGFRTWAYGLRLRNARMAKINNFHYAGDNSYNGVGIQFEKYTTAASGQCLGGYVTNCTFFGCEAGIACKDSCEGILTTSSAMVAVKYGFKWDYGVQLTAMQCHVNCQNSNGACVYVTGVGAASRVDQAVIIGNLFYPDASSTTGVLGEFWHSQICNNTFNSASSGATTIGIDLTGDSIYSSVSGNIFLRMASYGIRLGASSDHCKGANNIFDSCGTDVLDSGTANAVS